MFIAISRKPCDPIYWRNSNKKVINKYVALTNYYATSKSWRFLFLTSPQYNLSFVLQDFQLLCNNIVCPCPSRQNRSGIDSMHMFVILVNFHYKINVSEWTCENSNFHLASSCSF